MCARAETVIMGCNGWSSAAASDLAAERPDSDRLRTDTPQMGTPYQDVGLLPVRHVGSNRLGWPRPRVVRVTAGLSGTEAAQLGLIQQGGALRRHGKRRSPHARQW